MADTRRDARDDDDRAEITQRLTEHVGAGHLTLTEFDERLRRLHGTSDRAELAAVTADLPAIRTTTTQPARRAPRRWLVSLFGGSSLTGRWRIAGPLRSVAVFGGADIDLREAELDAGDVHITAISFMGGQDVYLPAGVDVHVNGVAILGGNDVHGAGQAGHAVLPGAPVVHVRALSLFGGTDVWRVPPSAARSSRREARRQIKGAR